MKKDSGNMNLQESIRRILREESDSGKYLKAVKVIVDDFKNRDFVCDIDVTYYAEYYNVRVTIDNKNLETTFEKESLWYAEELINRYLVDLRDDIRMEILDLLPVKVLISFRRIPHCGWEPLNESENKKSSLLSNIQENGLYDIIANTGLHVNEVEQKVGQLSREVLERFIKDVVKEHYQVIDDDGQTYIIYLEDYPYDVVPVDNSDYVEQLRVINNELFILVTLYEEDEYGDLEEQSYEIVSPKNLLYANIYEIAGQLGFLLSKGSI